VRVRVPPWAPLSWDLAGAPHLDQIRTFPARLIGSPTDSGRLDDVAVYVSPELDRLRICNAFDLACELFVVTWADIVSVVSGWSNGCDPKNSTRCERRL
jgi:hypothetical protein